MAISYDGSDIVFSSGRRAYAYCLVVGIDADLEPSYGFDGGFDWCPADQRGEEPKRFSDEVALADEDMIELADEMIDRWRRFKASLSPK